MNSKEIKLTITKSNLPASLTLVALEPKLAIALKIIGQTEKIMIVTWREQNLIISWQQKLIVIHVHKNYALMFLILMH